MRVSKFERAICNHCMEMRNKIRMVDEANVNIFAEQWGAHLLLAVQSRNVHNNCRKRSKAYLEYL